MAAVTITCGGEPAAIAGANGVTLLESIRALPDGHPTKRWVLYLCLYEREIANGMRPGPYEQGQAEREVRAALIDCDELIVGTLVGDSDAQLAATFRVPVAEIAAAHAEMGISQAQRARYLDPSPRR